MEYTAFQSRVRKSNYEAKGFTHRINPDQHNTNRNSKDYPSCPCRSRYTMERIHHDHRSDDHSLPQYLSSHAPPNIRMKDNTHRRKLIHVHIITILPRSSCHIRKDTEEEYDSALSQIIRIDFREHQDDYTYLIRALKHVNDENDVTEPFLTTTVIV
jgi:hypothetical protein